MRIDSKYMKPAHGALGRPSAVAESQRLTRAVEQIEGRPSNDFALRSGSWKSAEDMFLVPSEGALDGKYVQFPDKRSSKERYTRLVG